MDTPLRTRPAPGPTAALEPRQRTAVLGSLTIPGRPVEVAAARAFVTRIMAATGKGRTVDSDAATLLTSELVTNAIQHTASGADDGTVTIVVIDVPDGVLVEVIDDGSADMPVVKSDLLATDGHGLYLVQQLSRAVGLPARPGRHHGLVPPRRRPGPVTRGRRCGYRRAPVLPPGDWVISWRWGGPRSCRASRAAAW